MGNREGRESGNIGVATYLLWRPFKESLILLIGSPSNIIGERVVHDGIFLPGTSGAMESLLSFVENNMTVDEDHLVPIPNRASNPFTGVTSGEVDFRAEEVDQGPRSWFSSKEPSGILLGLFCLRHLRRLPLMKIRTVFKLLRTLPIPANDESRGVHTYDIYGRSNIANYKTIYVGSPLYTSIE